MRRIFGRKPRLSVLLVCTANICRSPMAEALLRHHLQARGLDRQVVVASAGIHALAGMPPDPRALAALGSRARLLRRKRARQLRETDLLRNDLILGMEAGHRRQLEEKGGDTPAGRFGLVTDFVPELAGADVPDPYYGTPAAFEQICQMLDRALLGLVAEVEHRLKDEEPASPSLQE